MMSINLKQKLPYLLYINATKSLVYILLQKYRDSGQRKKTIVLQIKRSIDHYRTHAHIDL